MKQLRIFFLCLMAATLATACGDDNNDDNSVPVESITLNHETLTLKSGATETLVPTIVPDRVTAESVVWSSDKTSVATVSKDGLVTAVAGRNSHHHRHRTRKVRHLPCDGQQQQDACHYRSRTENRY